jgi:hypothetical protein
MFYHGHFTHPELWMMWFSFVVSCFTTAAAIAAFAYLILKEKKK